MDILQVQDRLKNFSQDQLVGEMQAPTGNAPQFLVLSEIMRRKRLQDDFAAQQGKAGTESTVAQEAIAAAGVPQSGIAGMAQAIAPSTDMTQNTGVQAMASGGTVKKMQVGGVALTDPVIVSMANRSGMTVEEFLGSLRPEESANLLDNAARTSARSRMTATEPALSLGQDTQFQSVNPSYEEPTQSVFPNDTVRPPTGPATEYQPLYNPLEMLDRNKLPADQISPRPVAPADRPGALADVVPYTAADFPITKIEDYTGAVADYFNSPDETARGFDPYTGKAIDIPTLGTQFRQAGRGIAGGVTALVDKAGEALSSLPMFDMSMGNPYSELTADEMKALDSGQMDPATADRIQAERLAAKAPVNTGRADRDQQGIAAIPTAPEETTLSTKGPEQPAGPASEQPVAPVAPVAEQPVGPQGGSGSGSAGIAGAASGMTSYEQELMDALTRREQAAAQDKWLSLAQVGLNLMSSTNPTFAGALGEAGLAGVQAAQGARDQYEKDRLDLTGALEQSRMARAQAAAKAARGAGGSGGLGGIKLSQYLPQLRFAADAASDRVSLLTGDMDPTMAIAMAEKDGDTDRAMQIKIAYDDALRANSDYTNFVRSIGGLGGVVPEEDDTMGNVSD